MLWPYTAADGYLKSKNQPKTGSRNGGKYGVEVRRAGRVGEARYHHFGGVVTSPEATGVGRLEMQKAMPLDRRPTPPWWCSLLDGSTLVSHLFVLFLCSKCYGMVDKREFCFVLSCVL